MRSEIVGIGGRKVVVLSSQRERVGGSVVRGRVVRCLPMEESRAERDRREWREESSDTLCQKRPIDTKRAL